MRKNSLAVVPLGRGGEPIELAYAALFFASDECTYCTGADFECGRWVSLAGRFVRSRLRSFLHNETYEMYLEELCRLVY